MSKGITVMVNAADRARLEAVVANRNSPQKHVWRCRIVLLTAEGLGTTAIMQQIGKSKSVVWRWQERFMRAGVDGLLRDKTRPSRIPPLAQAVIDRVVALTSADPPGETTHWTAAAMAKVIGIVSVVGNLVRRAVVRHSPDTLGPWSGYRLELLFQPRLSGAQELPD